MPPKEKKNSTITKEKKSHVEDLTFGLKNKNKSKVVQKYVKEISDKVMYSQVKVSWCLSCAQKCLFLFKTRYLY